MSEPKTPQPPADLTKLQILDFDVMQEGWSTYDLEDGNRMRCRIVLLQMRAPDIQPKKGDPIAPQISQHVIVDVPPNRRGSPGHPATQEEVAKPKEHGGEEVAIRSSSEPWNEYHITNTNVRLRVKIIVNRIWKIRDRFDQNGDPVYVVTSTVIPVFES